MSEQTKHTRWPWVYRMRQSPYMRFTDQHKEEATIHMAGGSNCFAIVMLGGPGAISEDPASIEANARLIAAAPDLLSACEAMTANIERWLEKGIPAGKNESKALYDQMKAAIEKATEVKS